MTDDLRTLSLGELVRRMSEVTARNMPKIAYWESELEEHGHKTDKEGLAEAIEKYSTQITPYINELDRREKLYSTQPNPFQRY